MTIVPAPSLPLIVDDLLLIFRIERALPGSMASCLRIGLLRIARRQPAASSVIGRLLLIDRLRTRIAAGLGLAVAEQELDEAAAHVGALGIGGAHRGAGCAAWLA